MFYRSKSTIRYHIDRGNLTCRKTDGDRGVILITRDSLIRRFGNPAKIVHL